MREQCPKDRVKNFNEVPYGYTEEEAVREASRCLQCPDPPCVKGCPAEINIPGFIRAIKEKKFEKAVSVIGETSNLPAVCGRVCPQEDQCEVRCVLNKTGKPINIGALERFASEFSVKRASEKKPEGPAVAVIGSGPGGLTCAADLAEKGYRVTVFEALHKAGGVLAYGIPEFRLPNGIVAGEVDNIRGKGVEIKLNYVIGKIKTIEDLRREGFKAFYISSGAGLPYFLGIEGENLKGVYSANEFLTRINLMKAYKFPEYDTPVNVGRKAVVVGGGNVAMDSARSALRCGAGEVTVVYRRTEKEMPARRDEITHAREEGVKFLFLSSPAKILAGPQGAAKTLVCTRNELGPPDESGRRRPVPLENSEFEIPADTVIVAIGSGPNPLLLSTIKGLKLNGKGYIEADPEGRTSVGDIFAGGDIVTGSATVILAMGAGKRAARAMDSYLKEKE
ncbi:MAG: NADPH-dependent glutamate synthase [Candidatus Omnitrophica bacterium]|nr:NADPH-dependent glutamate synthase [Candidatus Omnitrophota bacterium]